MSRPADLPPAAFFDAVEALGRAQRDADPAGDLAHLRRVAAAGRALTVAGVLLAGLGPNPLSIVALSLGRFARWTMVGHHVCHRGYDKVGGPAGRSFGEGWRRALDWFDWLVPAAWKHEHNQLHHYRLNEARDPDLVEENLSWLRAAAWPLSVKRVVVAFFALTWRWVYYAPNTLAELHRAADVGEGLPRNAWTWDPRRPAGRDLWLRSLLPYTLVHFVLFPCLFLPFGVEVAVGALLNSLLAELLVNAHAFLVIVPNHAGPDLLRFDAPARGKHAFAWRQIRGSANFRTGGAVNDFLHGYLNYQIEHHLWPDLPMRAYARAAPELRALCATWGVPYVQESVWRRLGHTIRIMTGEASMGREAVAPAEAPPCASPAAR